MPKTALRQKRRIVTKTKDQILLERIKQLRDDSDKNFFEIGQALSEAYHSGDKDRKASYLKKWGYKNFSLFVEKVLGWKARTAYIRVAIYDCTVTYGITAQKAVKIGPGKMNLIASYAEATKAPVNKITEITTYAEEHPYDEFKAWLQEKRHKAGKGKRPQTKLFRFRLPKERAELAGRGLMRARNIIAERMDMKPEEIPDEEAFTLVFHEWLELVEKENSASTAEQLD